MTKERRQVTVSPPPDSTVTVDEFTLTLAQWIASVEIRLPKITPESYDELILGTEAT